MNKYQNSKIYTIRSNQTQLYYIGSTRDALYKRFHMHKKHYKAYLKGGIYLTSFEILKYDDVYIELLENYPCNSREELLMREGQLIRQYINEIVNKNRPSLTEEERKQYEKNHYINNIDRRKEYNTEYRKTHIDLIKQYSEKHNKIKYRCEICDLEMLKNNKYNHLKSINHINKQNNIIN
jgi:hypothetical protein